MELHFGLDLFTDFTSSTPTHSTHPILTARSLPCFPLHFNHLVVPLVAKFALASPPLSPLQIFNVMAFPFCHTHNSGNATPSCCAAFVLVSH